MKHRFKLFILLALFQGLFWSSCNDNLTSIGTHLLQPNDLITIYTDTFHMKATTVKVDSIYAKTSNFMLGEMYDPVYGTIKADLLCQFYCEEGFQFAYAPVDGKIDSMELIIFYNLNSNGGLAVYGDTITPMEVTIYPINQPLKRNFYTNDQPEKYCDMQNPLGSVTYTAYDMTVSDSLRESGSFSPYLRVKLPTELGQRFYDETINNPSTFSNQSAFNAFFPGVYITNTYGSGCLIPSTGEYIAIRIFFQIWIEPDEDYPEGTFATADQRFYVAKDVVQINRFKNSNFDQLLVGNPTHTYVKSPAGVFTKLTLPTTEISKEIDINDRYINGFTLNLKYLPEDERYFAYAPPSHLLLLPEDSLTTFFERGSVENNSTSFISFSTVDDYGSYTSSYETPSGYTPGSRTYAFGNISKLLKTHIDQSPDKDLSLLVIPVTRKASPYNEKYYTTNISHNFSLSGVKIRTEEEYMKVVVLSSKYENR